MRHFVGHVGHVGQVGQVGLYWCAAGAKKRGCRELFSFAAALGVGKSNLSELDLFDPGVGDQVVSGEGGMNPVGGPEF